MVVGVFLLAVGVFLLAVGVFLLAVGVFLLVFGLFLLAVCLSCWLLVLRAIWMIITCVMISFRAKNTIGEFQIDMSTFVCNGSHMSRYRIHPQQLHNSHRLKSECMQMKRLRLGSHTMTHLHYRTYLSIEPKWLRGPSLDTNVKEIHRKSVDMNP